jgi:putative transposase
MTASTLPAPDHRGTEQIFGKAGAWCAEKGIELRHIQPDKPNQNAFIERFNRSYRNEVLNGWLFSSLDDVREIAHQWIASYNAERPHNALG